MVAVAERPHQKHSTASWSKIETLSRRVDRFYQTYPNGHSTNCAAKNSDTVILSTNDYLNLARDPRIIQAQIEALQAQTDEVFMSGVFLAGDSPQRRFERRMADFLGVEEVVLAQSGFAANDGLIQAIADPFTPVYLDIYAHTSLWQGAHSASAKVRPFRHNDPHSLRALIRRYGPGVIAVDSIYSTLGDICPIEEFAAIAQEEGCLFVVDESHSMGVFGPEGSGLLREPRFADLVHFRTFSLSKAFVGRAGIIAGPARVLEYLRYESRPAIFSSTVLSHEVAGFSATLEAIRTADNRRARLARNARRLREGLLSLGYDTGGSQTQIVPLIAGPEDQTVRLRQALEARNIQGAVFCAPATPKNRSLVRLSVTSAQTDAEIERVLEACAEIRYELPFLFEAEPQRRALAG